ncbi:MAG: acetyl-CoA hydrolase/transferase C-terminal domain-containing protein [Pseudomonadales bacterium]|nr:acetyl-CoA hydrolase/transferase C-terminal domain-containing protein [Pseudomonadales bacterium]
MSAWRNGFEKKLTTAKQAVSLIKSGSSINIPIFAPRSLLDALWGRRDELANVRLLFNAPTDNPGWFDSNIDHPFALDFEIFIGDVGRASHDRLQASYIPNLFSSSFKHVDEARPGVNRPLVALVSCSPPNKAGFVHFGAHHWTKRSLIRRADLVIAEIDDTLLQVHGDVYAHVSEFDCFVKGETQIIGGAEIAAVLEQIKPEYRDQMAALIPKIPQERLRLVYPLLAAIDPESLENQLGLGEPPEEYVRIARHLAPLIEDGDCIQIGVGEPSSLMVKLGVFDDKNDLGVHTELIAPGTAGLVEKGIVTGRRKNQLAGIVAAAAWTGGSDEDFAIIEDNPTFQLFDPEFILDVRRIAANERQVSINNALSVDLTGQINAETVFGARMINGTGGQPENHIGAFLSSGGRAITLLPSTALDGVVSRIVPQMETGSLVTIPRYYADVIVTEHGVAHLTGKSHRERAEALINVAHPNFRGELTDAARKFFG